MRVCGLNLAAGIALAGAAVLLSFRARAPSRPEGSVAEAPGGGTARPADPPHESIAKTEAKPGSPESGSAPEPTGWTVTGRVLRKERRTLPAPGVSVHLKPAPRQAGRHDAP